MTTKHNEKKGTRLIDFPNMPVDEAIKFMESKPEWFGVALAKLCCSQIASNK